MRIDEIAYQRLDEIAMNPNALAKAVQSINATAGMEFELIVSGIGSIDDDPYAEPDFSNDERLRSLDDISDFFYHNDELGLNHQGDVQSWVEEIQEAYHEWQMERIDEDFYENRTAYVQEYFREHMTWESMMEFYHDEIQGMFEDEGLDWNEDWDEGDHEQIAQIARENMIASEIIFKLIDTAIENQDQIFDSTRERNQEDAYEEERFSISDFFQAQGWNYVSDLWQNRYDIPGFAGDSIYWPHQGGGNGEEKLQELADEFSQVVEKHTNFSTGYHSGERNEGEYTIEPDSSLEGDGTGDTGLEFISPPMPLGEMIQDIDAIVAWAKGRGVYTNSSTGLHMNVSIPNYSRDSLDFVKLALLVGDQHVLQTFGRQFNNYAVSAFKKIENEIARGDADLPMLFSTMKNKADSTASDFIKGQTGKFTSINVKNGWVEFRSPGGDWLNGDIDDVKNTLMRFAVALDAACDPQKYRQEYLKKLYKLVQSASPSGNSDITKLFAQYVAGEISRDELKDRANTQRRARGGKPVATAADKKRLMDALNKAMVATEKWAQTLSPEVPHDVVRFPIQHVAANPQEAQDWSHSVMSIAQGDHDKIQNLYSWFEDKLVNLHLGRAGIK